MMFHSGTFCRVLDVSLAIDAHKRFLVNANALQVLVTFY